MIAELRVGAVGAPAPTTPWHAMSRSDVEARVGTSDLGFIGVVLIVDALIGTIQEGKAAGIAALRRDGLRVIMQTGNGRDTAEAVGRTVGGLDDIRADLGPADKAQIIPELKASGAGVAMAEDGIDDAPALAAANVGVAMSRAPMSRSRARASR